MPPWKVVWLRQGAGVDTALRRARRWSRLAQRYNCGEHYPCAILGWEFFPWGDYNGCIAEGGFLVEWRWLSYWEVAGKGLRGSLLETLVAVVSIVNGGHGFSSLDGTLWRSLFLHFLLWPNSLHFPLVWCYPSNSRRSLAILEGMEHLLPRW